MTLTFFKNLLFSPFFSQPTAHMWRRAGFHSWITLLNHKFNVHLVAPSYLDIAMISSCHTAPDSNDSNTHDRDHNVFKLIRNILIIACLHTSPPLATYLHPSGACLLVAAMVRSVYHHLCPPGGRVHAHIDYSVDCILACKIKVKLSPSLMMILTLLLLRMLTHPWNNELNNHTTTQCKTSLTTEIWRFVPQKICF